MGFPKRRQTSYRTRGHEDKSEEEGWTSFGNNGNLRESRKNSARIKASLRLRTTASHGSRNEEVFLSSLNQRFCHNQRTKDSATTDILPCSVTSNLCKEECLQCLILFYNLTSSMVGASCHASSQHGGAYILAKSGKWLYKIQSLLQDIIRISSLSLHCLSVQCKPKVQH